MVERRRDGLVLTQATVEPDREASGRVVVNRAAHAHDAVRRAPLAGAAHAPFDDRALDAMFEIGRGNLHATDDLAFSASSSRESRRSWALRMMRR